MKQTAVDWLVETLNNKIDYIPIKHWDYLREIIQQAKAMHKEEIVKAAADHCYPTFCSYALVLMAHRCCYRQ